MRTIRSLLWIGSGRGLSESGITEAPELDVTWVPKLEEALRLPRVHFDGILLETGSLDGMEESLAALSRHSRGTSILVSLPDAMAAHATALVAAGAAAVLLRDPTRSGPGIVSEVNAILDGLHEAASPGPVHASRATGPEIPSQAAAAYEATPLEPGTLGGEPSPQVVATSPAMQEVSTLIEQAAASPSTVLLTGETGVGKEVVARQLHLQSGREHEPFVAINCAAFPESLLESELFGQGTLFLDEIAEMGLPLQAKLLRVLQEREIRPVGGTRQVAIRCRIVAATNRILAEEVVAGHFREDLFYRLNVFPIRIPSLRARRPDILPLAHHFLALHGPREGKPDCHLSLAAGQLLESYTWPGNVRELENEMLRALMLSNAGQLITPKVLSPKIVEILEPVAQGARPDETLREALERVEAWLIRRALANNGGRKARTARRLGLTREGLYKKIKRLGVE
jgi:transcriptional regulator with AAA-type ATPase domain